MPDFVGNVVVKTRGGFTRGAENFRLRERKRVITTEAQRTQRGCGGKAIIQNYRIVFLRIPSVISVTSVVNTRAFAPPSAVSRDDRRPRVPLTRPSHRAGSCSSRSRSFA